MYNSIDEGYERVNSAVSQTLQPLPGPRCECSPVNKPSSLALPLFWLDCRGARAAHCTPSPPLCLSEVGKPSWVGIWFLGTDAFHGWRHYKSLKRDPALGRHSINTDNTSPSLLLTRFPLTKLSFHFFFSLLSPSFSIFLPFSQSSVLTCWAFFSLNNCMASVCGACFHLQSHLNKCDYTYTQSKAWEKASCFLDE